ncbi:MAG: TIGR01212 family radical SAM protein [Acidobacteriota bacterium]
MDHVSPRDAEPRPYNAVSARWRAIFGRAARKVPLDAGFGCPNRDGALATGGCIFCNARGSGTGLGQRMALSAQWTYWSQRLRARWGHDLALVGYLQAFSNTHGPAARLAAVLHELAALPDMAGLCLATRPDCLDEEKIALLAAFPVEEFWLELGLQSSNPATLARIRRGHGAACFADAVRMAADAGLKVTAHVMAGLPGETRADWDATVDFVNALPVAGVKFHNVYAARDTELARMHLAGEAPLPELEEYADFVACALARLRPEIVVHRLHADPAHGELVAPAWAGARRRLHNTIAEVLRVRGVRQGMNRTERT